MMQFSATIDGDEIRCTVTSDRALSAPVFCYSCIGPTLPTFGAELISSLGSYAELQLLDLKAGETVEFGLRFDLEGARPLNRAWLPMGVFLRGPEGVLTLPPLPSGVIQEDTAPQDHKAPDLRLCPQPTDFTPSSQTVAIAGINCEAPEFARVDHLAQRTGLGHFLAPKGHPVVLKSEDTIPREGYRLVISPDEITVFHSSTQGVFHAAVTLLTLMVTHQHSLPCGTISDSPRFEWRGQHLDCARHFYEVETILRLLDLMALLKLNRFHWHFADDEAFRLELESLPELSKTHFRGEGEMLPGLFGGGLKAGGAYSRADAERVIAHAKDLNIEVMPEIEVPAHALALCRVFPKTRDPLDIGTETSVQGYKENAMNPALPESWRVWEAMAQEVGEIFPFEVLHLGGDELAHGTWQGSPAAQALIQSEGLATTQDLQGWTMNRLATKVAASGKVPGGWEEAVLGKQGIENDAIIFSWTGQKAGLQAARDGYRVVMMPGQRLYLDMAHTASEDDWGAGWAAIIGLEDTIDWDPVPENEPQLEDRIIGVEGAFWSEFTTKDGEMEAMLAPRILGVATMGWQPRGSASKEDLFGLAAVYSAIFAKHKWQAFRV